MRTKQEIKEFLENLEERELFRIYNEYADKNYYEPIYQMNEFNEIMNGETPEDITLKIYYGDFNPNNDYFVFNGQGNLKSMDYISDYIDFNDITNYILDNEDCLDSIYIENFLNEEE